MQIKIKRIILATFLALGFVFPAHAAVKTKSALTSEINSQFPNNNAGSITPAILRSVTGDIVDSSQQTPVVNAQVGTTYTILLGDFGKVITLNNASSIAIAIPQANGSFTNFNVYVSNEGIGTAIITPTVSTINGAASLTLLSGQGVWIISDGTNYKTPPGKTSALTLSITNADVAPAAGIVYSKLNLTSSLVAGDVNTSNLNLWQSTIGVRQALTTGLSFYVRTDGNDSNSCLVNNSGGACLTLQGAWNKIANGYDLRGFTATVNISNGTYAAGMLDLNAPAVGGPVSFVGNVGTPGNVIISASSGDCFEISQSVITISGMKLTNSGGSDVHAYRSGVINISSGIEFGAASESHMFADNEGQIIAQGNYTINGNAPYHWLGHTEGYISVISKTVTLSGTPTFSSTFAYAVRGGVMEVADNTYTGSATGIRFITDNGGSIYTNCSLTCLPGDAAGQNNAGFYNNVSSGGITGPASSTNNAIMRWDGTTGTVAQDSAVLIADTTGIISGTKGITLSGSTSGSLAITSAAVSGSNSLKFPAGTTDFSATGGTSQVIKQTSAGGALTVGQLAASDLSNGTSGSGAVCLVASCSMATPILGAATATSLSLSGLTASSAIATDGSKNLVSVTNTGSGNNVLATTPTVTGISSNNYAVTGSSPSANGIYLPTANTIGLTARNLDAMRLTNPASSVNYWSLSGAATGSSLTMQAAGSDSNIALYFMSKGISNLFFATQGSTSNVQMAVGDVSSSVNYLQFNGGATGNSPQFLANGSDSNIGANFIAKGAGTINLSSNLSATNINFSVAHSTTSAVNYVQATGAVTTAAPSLTSTGSDSNVPLRLDTKGTGAVISYTGGTERMRIDSKSHLGYTATAPTISSCGTTPSTARGTDSAGEVTEGTTATGCTITFANSGYTAAPYCVVTSQTQLAAFTYAISTTAITVTNTSTSNDKINWVCHGT